jgi:hypothetical protein
MPQITPPGLLARQRIPTTRSLQALAVLEGVESILAPTEAITLAHTPSGRWAVRYAEEIHAGASPIDALAQFVQSHPEDFGGEY